MVERFSLNLSYRRLPGSSERSSIPCQLARSCQKWTRLDADKGNDLGAAKCYVIGSTGGPKMKSRIIMPVRTVFSSRQWSRGRERNTTWAQEQTPSNLFTPSAPVREKSSSSEYSLNPERTESTESTEGESDCRVFHPAEEGGALFRRGPFSLREYIRSDCIR